MHEKVFAWVLKLVAGHGLVKGEPISGDGSAMEANAALRIVRRDTDETYRQKLTPSGQAAERRAPGAGLTAKSAHRRRSP